MYAKSLQSCLTVCNPVDYSPFPPKKNQFKYSIQIVIDFTQVRIPIFFLNPPMKSMFSGSKGKRKQTTMSKRNIPKAVIHQLRRKRNGIKENGLRLKVLMLTANSAGLSVSNQHSMRTLHLSTQILLLYITNQWLEIYRLE